MECLKRMKIKNGMDMMTEFPCGKCLPCVITRRQEWTCRLLLEMKVSLWTYFVTLTYADIDLPPQGQLHKPDLQDFFKRLRKNTGLKLRYFAAGEYGEKGRAHYHLLVFTNGEMDLCFDNVGRNKVEKCVDSDFHKAWYTSSFVDVVPILGDKSARNICAYVAGS